MVELTGWLTPALLATVLVGFALLYRFLQRHYPEDHDTLIEAVDALLPQTQCAQCNYPGCRPYAQAIVDDGAALNLCPPGGAELHEQLITLMGDELAGSAPQQTGNVIAVIDESECIGCALCLPPCPVDAIVGAANKMHTVVSQDCTGCELCVPACPVDCISLVPVAAPVQQRRRRRRPKRQAPLPQTTTPPATPIPTPMPRACINCGQCNPVCPVELPAQGLLQSVQQGRLDFAVTQQLMSCVECALCDQACPSDIPMADLFANAKWQHQQALDDDATRHRFKQRFDAHQERLMQAAQQANQRRRERLQRTKDTSRWT